MQEVSVTTLKGETAANIHEGLYDIQNGSVNSVDMHSGQTRLPLPGTMRIIDKFFGFRESLHLLQLLDFFFHFLCTFGIQLLFVRDQLAKQPQELTGMNALFIGDVL